MIGSDLYLELDESVLNEVMAAGWQTGLATAKGTFSFAGKVTPALAPYAEVDWRLTLNGEPLVDMQGPGKVFVHCEAKLELLVLTMLPLTFDVALHIINEIDMSAKERKIIFTPTAVVIDRLIIRNQVRVTDEFLRTLNRMLSTALLSYISKNTTTFTLPDITLDVSLPHIPDTPENQLPITFDSFVILNQKRIAVGVTLLSGQVTGNKLLSAASSAPVFISLNQTAIRSMVDFWWDKVDWSVPFKFDGTMPLNAALFVKKSREALTRLVTLGFIQRENDINNLQLIYTGNIFILSKPNLHFESPDQTGIGDLKLKLELDVKIHADVSETLLLDTSSFIPDTLTPWKDDLNLKQQNGKQEILHLSQTLLLDINEVVTALSANAEGNIVMKAVKADLKLDFGDQWYQNLPENLMNGLLKLFNQKIIDHLPPLVISPAILLKDFRVLRLTPVVSPQKISIHGAATGLYGEETVAIESGFDVAELKGKVHVPGYIANKRSQKIHRITCDVIKDIRPEHQEGYFVLHEALRDGYKSCKNCLKGAEIL